MTGRALTVIAALLCGCSGPGARDAGLEVSTDAASPSPPADGGGEAAGDGGPVVLRRGEPFRASGAVRLLVGDAELVAEDGTELVLGDLLELRFGTLRLVGPADGGVSRIKVSFGAVAGFGFTVDDDGARSGRITAELGSPTFIDTKGREVKVAFGSTVIIEAGAARPLDETVRVLALGASAAAGLAAARPTTTAGPVRFGGKTARAAFAEGRLRCVAPAATRGALRVARVEAGEERLDVALDEGELWLTSAGGLPVRYRLDDGPELTLRGGLAHVVREGSLWRVEPLVGRLGVTSARRAVEVSPGDRVNVATGGPEVTSARRAPLALEPGANVVYSDRPGRLRFEAPADGTLTLRAAGRALAQARMRAGDAARVPVAPGAALAFTFTGRGVGRDGTLTGQAEPKPPHAELAVDVTDAEQTRVVKSEGQELVLRFRWATDPRAARYELTLYAADRLETPLTVARADAARLELRRALAPGEYLWAPVAYDGQGRALAGTKLRKLSVVEEPASGPLLVSPRRLDGDGPLEVSGRLPGVTRAILNGEPLAPAASGAFAVTTPVSDQIVLTWRCARAACALVRSKAAW